MREGASCPGNPGKKPKLKSFKIEKFQGGEMREGATCPGNPGKKTKLKSFKSPIDRIQSSLRLNKTTEMSITLISEQ